MRHELSHDPPPIIPEEPVLVNTVPVPLIKILNPKMTFLTMTVAS